MKYCDTQPLQVNREHQLVWLVYGENQNYIDEAIFSTLSAIYTSKKVRPLLRIFTDTPDAFSDLPVELDIINKQDLNEWSGKDNYNHRAKPCALLKALDKAEKSVFIDTDTFFKKEASHLFQLIDQETVLVDAIEGRWGICSTASEEKLYNSVGELLRSKYSINDDLCFVNSGIIGVDKAIGADVLNKAIEVIDSIYVLSGKIFSIEQFSLAVAIKALGYDVVAHNSVIHHYWGRKTIHRAIIKSWLMDFKGRYFSSEAVRAFHHLKLTIPKPNALARLKYKLKALRLEKELRQFYIEISRACHKYRDQYWRGAKIESSVKALENLKERYPQAYVNLISELNSDKSQTVFNSEQLKVIYDLLRPCK